MIVIGRMRDEMEGNNNSVSVGTTQSKAKQSKAKQSKAKQSKATNIHGWAGEEDSIQFNDGNK